MAGQPQPTQNPSFMLDLVLRCECTEAAWQPQPTQNDLPGQPGRGPEYGRERVGISGSRVGSPGSRATVPSMEVGRRGLAGRGGGQGMSDLAAPLLVVMNDEAEAFWAFAALMETFESNFNVDGTVPPPPPPPFLLCRGACGCSRRPVPVSRGRTSASVL